MAISKVTFFVALFLFASVAFAGGWINGDDGAWDDSTNTMSGGPTADYRDVCIVGGGAAGSAAAVFLRDRNYSVVVIERQANLGGHCDTVNFPVPPGVPLPFGWVDIGVAFTPDTAKLNAMGLGPWDVDSAAFFSRFHPFGPSAIIHANLSASTTPTYNFNFNTGTLYGSAAAFPPASPSADYVDAWNRYFNIVNNTYHWLSLNEYPTNWYPDRIPNDLLNPFAQWINDNNMTALLPVFQAFLNPAGVGDWQNVPALWCVLAVPPSILQSIAVPNTGFVLFGGCQPFYDGVLAWLTASNPNNVQLNSVVTQVKRVGSGSKPILMDTINTVTNATSRFSCSKLIVAHPQTLSNLQNYMDLDIVESLVFSQVRTRYYFNGVANVNGGTYAPGGFGTFSFHDEDTSRAFSQQDFPGLISFARQAFPFGPASILGSSETPMSNADFQTLASQQINLLNPYINATVAQTNYHEYQPYPVSSALNHPIGFYTQLRLLQGHRNTYYIGALASYAGTYLVWEQAYDLIKHEF